MGIGAQKWMNECWKETLYCGKASTSPRIGEKIRMSLPAYSALEDFLKNANRRKSKMGGAENLKPMHTTGTKWLGLQESKSQEETRHGKITIWT